MMRNRWMLLAAAMILGVAGCTYGPGDCAPHPIDLTPAEAERDSPILLASGCHRIITVDGVQYLHQGEYALLADVIERLEIHGSASEANDDWVTELESQEDLVVWEVEGVDPGRALWGTSAALRGTTNRYVLWTIDNCSELDACEPPICDPVDLADRNAAERCGALTT
jgi:hypothetical protein